VGYRGARRTSVGENILSWAASLTPSEVVAKWMASPSHRQAVLGRTWRDVGAAIVTHSITGVAGVTVVVEFGRRS
jgi:uncharacterized protein YkwD